MAKSRKDAWLRDEVILALDLYRREGRSPPPAAIAEVSEQLRGIPIERHLVARSTFRNLSSVRLKVANFVALDPDATTAGMRRGSQLDAKVFQEFWPEPSWLAETADAIRANLTALSPVDADAYDDIEDAPEGRILTRVHRVRERNAKLRRKKKALTMEKTGRLECEVCDFDFSAAYGERGRGFIECHHMVPLRDLKPGARTRLEDLALLCANCHRMIHVRSPWLSLSQLREILAAHPEAAPERSALEGKDRN